jgi:competence protein ComEC
MPHLRRALEIWERPSVAVFLGLATGLSASAGWGMLFFLAPLAFLCRRNGLWAAALLGGLAGILMRPAVGIPPLIERGFAKLQLVITTVPTEDGGGFRARSEGEGKQYDVSWKGRVLSFGDLVEVEGDLKPSSELAARRGVDGSIRVRGTPRVISQGPLYWEWGSHVRTSFRDFVSSALPARSAGLLMGLCMGVASEMSPEDRKAVAESGAAHIVAASGMNVLILAAGVIALLSRAPFPRPFQLGLLMVLLLVYGGAAGLGTPIVRAILMAAIYLGAELAGREPDPLSSGATAGIATLMLDPRDIFSPSFWLSFAVVFAIVLYGTRPWIQIKELPWLAAKGEELVRISVVAMAGAAPVTAVAFGSITTLGLITNILVVPFCSLAVILPLVLWLGSFVWPEASAGLLGLVMVPVMEGMLAVFHGVASLPGAVVAVPEIPAWIAAAVGLLVLAAWKPQPREATE